jgi:hypothetical protein
MRLAARIAINRTVAGLHYPVDSAVGQTLGLSLAEYFVNLALPTNPAQPLPHSSQQYDCWIFDGSNYPGTFDFDGRDQLDTSTPKRYDPNPGTLTPYVRKLSTHVAKVSPPLQWLWGKAAGEWL